jgi:hypothetical protein
VGGPIKYAGSVKEDPTMPKLKYHAFDRVFDDPYPFPSRRDGLPMPRLVGGEDSIRRAESAMETAQRRLDNLRALLNQVETDPDRPRAA